MSNNAKSTNGKDKAVNTEIQMKAHTHDKETPDENAAVAGGNVPAPKRPLTLEQRLAKQLFSETTALAKQLSDEARELAKKRHTKMPPDEWNRRALILFEVIDLAERKRTGCRSIQALAAIRIVKEALWLSYPPTWEHPDGFGSLKEMLQAAGLGRRAIYDLTVVAEIIVPYCEANDIDIIPCVTYEYTKLAEVISYLKHQIRDESSTPDDIKATLAKVHGVPDRETIRFWRQSQPGRDHIGFASVHRQGVDGAIVVLRLNDEDDVQGVLTSSGIRGKFRFELLSFLQLKPSQVGIWIDEQRYRSLRDGTYLGLPAETSAAPMPAPSDGHEPRSDGELAASAQPNDTNISDAEEE